jgi:hypothetical protein
VNEHEVVELEPTPVHQNPAWSLLDTSWTELFDLSTPPFAASDEHRSGMNLNPFELFVLLFFTLAAARTSLIETVARKAARMMGISVGAVKGRLFHAKVAPRKAPDLETIGSTTQP